MIIIDHRAPGPVTHHPNMGPSSIPAILQCSEYYSTGDESEDTEKGSLLHEVTQDIFAGKQKKFTEYGISRKEFECCEWGAKEATDVFEMYDRGETIHIEERLEIRDDHGRLLSWGYCDLNGRIVVVDLKSGLDYRPDMHWHEPQLKTYSLAKFRRDRLEKILCVELYLMPRKKREYWVSLGECEAVFASAIIRRNERIKRPVINDYCHFCKRIIWCEAINKIAWRTVELFAEANGLQDLIAQPDKINCPAIMATALTVSRKILKPLQDRIEAAALKLSETKKIPYYIRTASHTRDKIVDVKQAFNRLPFSNDEFCKALSVSPSKLSEVYADKYKVNSEESRKIIGSLVQDLISREQPSPILKPILKERQRAKKNARGDF